MNGPSCSLRAPVTMLSLAGPSEALVVVNRAEAVEGAMILDELDPKDLAEAMARLRELRAASNSNRTRSGA